jgi:hypothetical protein
VSNVLTSDDDARLGHTEMCPCGSTSLFLIELENAGQHGSDIFDADFECGKPAKGLKLANRQVR